MNKEIKNASMLAEFFSENLNLEDVIEARELAKISAEIGQYRIDRGMNQEQFAKHLGISQGLVSRWESEDYNFTIRNLAKICAKLDMDLDISFRPNKVSYNNVSSFDTAKWNNRSPVVDQSKLSEAS